jgi:hypothetical protein
MVVSRFGSIVMGPVLKWTSFVKFEDYKKFLAAKKKDEQIELLSEVNNTYRTLCALFGLLLLLKLYVKIADRLPWLKDWHASGLVLLLFLLFLFSYRKQTSFVAKRIRAAE